MVLSGGDAHYGFVLEASPHTVGFLGGGWRDTSFRAAMPSGLKRTRPAWNQASGFVAGPEIAALFLFGVERLKLGGAPCRSRWLPHPDLGERYAPPRGLLAESKMSAIKLNEYKCGFKKEIWVHSMRLYFLCGRVKSRPERGPRCRYQQSGHPHAGSWRHRAGYRLEYRLSQTLPDCSPDLNQARQLEQIGTRFNC